MSLPKVVGKIAYTNTEPFFYKWPHEAFPLKLGVPRELALAARAGEIVAAALPVVECWSMEDKFTSLGFWGIAAKERCDSVLVFSKRPFAELHNIIIGVTRQSATSVVLCDVLIREKYKHRIQMRRGFQPTDIACLVIGDDALRMSEAQPKEWPYVTDLATEWWNWHKLPFVFAQWVARANDHSLHGELTRVIHDSFSAGRTDAALAEIGIKEAVKLRIAPERITAYLKNMQYILDQNAEDSMYLFRELAGKQPDIALAGKAL